MKRDDSLRPLSREHLGALTVAKKLRDADNSTGLAETFLNFWQEDGQRHFRVEEEVLLPIWAMHASVDRPGVMRMLEDHLTIRRWALEIETRGLSVDEACDLGELLNAHVRFEERELFPQIEADLDGTALRELAVAIEKAEAQPH